MADKNSYPLSLLLKAVDGVTAPLRRIQGQIDRVKAPAMVASNAIASIGQVGGLDRLRDGLVGVLGSARSVGTELSSLTKRLAVGLGAAGFAAYEFVQPTIESSASLKRQADRLGMTTDELASYRFAAREAGLENDELAKGFDFFNKTLGQAKAGGGSLHGLLVGKGAGPNVLHELTTAKSTSDAINILLQRMDQLPDKSKRAALSAAAFGRGAMNMENFAELGAKRIAELRAQQQLLGGSQKDFADNAVEATRAEAELGEAWEGTRRTFLAPVLPILMTQLRDLSGWLVSHRQDVAGWARDGAQAIGEFADSLPRRLQSFFSFASGVMSALQPVADLVGGWPTLIAGVATAIVAGPLIGALAQLTASFVSLGLAIGFTPLGWLIGTLAAFAAAVAGLIALFRWLNTAEDDAAKPREFSAPTRYRDAGAFMRGEERLQSSHATAFDEHSQAFGRGNGPASGSRSAPAFAFEKFAPSAPVLSPAFRDSSSLQPESSHAAADTVRIHPDDIQSLTSGMSGDRSHVTVDFRNVPRGTQIAPSQNSRALGLSLGISMAESH